MKKAQSKLAQAKKIKRAVQQRNEEIKKSSVKPLKK